jgi:hypothetical protein
VGEMGADSVGVGGGGGEGEGGRGGLGGAWGGRGGRAGGGAHVRACVHAPFDLPPIA